VASSDVRRLHASYAVHGDESLDRTFPLDDGETILGRGDGRVRQDGRTVRADYRISTDRLCIVTHRRVRHGEALSIPRSSIGAVDGPDGRGRVTVAIDDGTIVVVTPATRAQAVALVDTLST
jgi:hypothetical protein